MDDQGTKIFFSRFKKRSKYDSVLSPIIPHVLQVGQDQSEEDRYMLTSFNVTR